NHSDSPDQLLRYSAAASDGHVILHLAHAICMQKTRNENGGIRPIELLVNDLVPRQGNPKAPAFPVIQNCGKDAWRIEVRQAEPVDRAVHPHQRGGVHIPDKSVILDRLVAWLHVAVPSCRYLRGSLILLA